MNVRKVLGNAALALLALAIWAWILFHWREAIYFWFIRVPILVIEGTLGFAIFIVVAFVALIVLYLAFGLILNAYRRLRGRDRSN